MEELEDVVLANASRFVASRHQADADLVAGRTRSLDLLARDGSTPTHPWTG